MSIVSNALAAALCCIVVAGGPVPMPQCWDIAPVNEVWPDWPNCAAGGACYGGCNVYNSWVPGTSCKAIASCGSTTVICYAGRFRINQFGQCVCMGWGSSPPKSITVGIPCCQGACEGGGGGGER